MDIRRYFGNANNAKSKLSLNKEKEKGGKEGDKKKQQQQSENGNSSKKRTSARKRLAVIESDDEDEEEPLPSKKKKKKDRIEIEKFDSDNEEVLPKRSSRTSKASPPSSTELRRSPRKTVPPASPLKLKFVSAADFFGVVPVKHSKETTVSKKNALERKLRDRSNGYEIHEDDDFIETLKTMDDAENAVQTEKVVSRAPPSSSRCEKAIDRARRPSGEISDGAKSRTPSSKKSENKKRTEETASSAEKKAANVSSFLRFKQREGPSALGSKEVPGGEEGCFKGLNFVVTGVLDSLERNEAEELVKKYDGKVQKSVCKNTSYMVVGKEAGPSKLEKAQKMGTKLISEDEFLDLIRTMPGTKHQRKSKTVTTSTPKKENKEERKQVAKEQNQTTKPVVKMQRLTNETVSKEKSKPNDCDLMWVDKYRPLTTKQIIGQQGDKSNVKKLTTWLRDWHRNHSGANAKKKKAVFGRFGAEDGSHVKAALLSGSPGVGKTTSAQLVCKELGFTYVELNASDTRSKKNLQEVVFELLRNKSLTHYIAGNPSEANKHCLLMDEVDGMAGNEDRGGVQELIQLIRSSKIPIICMCNDRNHQKIRSLANYCFDLRFQKPRVEQLKGALMSICFKEGVEISSEALQEVIVGSNQDVRQILHHLSMWSVKNKKLSVEETTRDAKMSKKDLKVSPFDALRCVFSASEHKTMSIHDKSDLFFHDYSLSPLFVQENYLNVIPNGVQKDICKHLRLVSRAADSICKGDLVDRLIRSESQWGLLPTQAMFASVIPGDLLAGHLGQMINFPSWLGRNSTRSKTDRLLQELHMHTRLRTSGNKTNLNMDYLEHILSAIVRPLLRKGAEGVSEAVAVTSDYYLLREDLDAIVDVSLWPNRENPLSKLSPQVKAAFTRGYNKVAHLNPYAAISLAVKRKKGSGTSNEDGGGLFEEEDEEGQEEVEEEDVKLDAMIKKQAPKRKTKKDDDETAGPSKKKGPGRPKKVSK